MTERIKLKLNARDLRGWHQQIGASLHLPMLILVFVAIAGGAYSWHLTSKRKASQERIRQEESERAAAQAQRELAQQQAQLAALASKPETASATAAPSVTATLPAAAANSNEASTLKSAEQLYAELSKSTALIQVFNSSGQRISMGSGVVIENGVVITNCHVTRNGTQLKLHVAGKTTAAKVIVADEVYDLCKLQGDAVDAPAVQLGSAESLRIGQKVYALGAPQGLDLTISDGIISSLRDLDGTGKIIQTTTPISPGSSGGGLFDAAGKLIGITTFQHRSGQNLNFAVPVDWIRSMQNRKNTGKGVGRLTIESTAPERSGGERASGEATPNSKIAGLWVCFSPITGNGFEMTLNQDGSVDALSNNKKLVGRYFYDGKTLSLSGNGVLTGVIDEFKENKFVINYQNGRRIVCNRKQA